MSAAEWIRMTREVATRYGIDPDIAVSQIRQESGYSADVALCRRKSSAGAAGLSQFIPGTFAVYGRGGNVCNPADALEAYGRYMQKLLAQFNGNYRSALAAYNAGEGAVAAFLEGRSVRAGGKTINPRRIKTPDGVPPYTETQNYVTNILARAGRDGGGGSTAVPPPPPPPKNTDTQALWILGGGAAAIILLAALLR